MPKAGHIVAGKYRIERCLGAGAMGSVWAAMHLELDAPVAIKFETSDPNGARRAGASRREARAAARLRSPHVVRVHDFGVDDDVTFIVMELLEGQSLKERLDAGASPSPNETADIVSQVARALDEAHAERLVHRDIKPSNIFLAREGDRELVKVLDFGIAKWLDSEVQGEARTESLRVVGSAAYMSPEQARGEAVDARSDVWSLAVLAYELLLGARPFGGNNIPETLNRICAGDYPSPSSCLGLAHVPLDPVFVKGLHLDLARRYQSAGVFARSLAQAVQQLPEPAEPRKLPYAPDKLALGRSSQTASLRMVRSINGVARDRRKTLSALLAVSGVSAASYWVLFRDKPEMAPATPSVMSAVSDLQTTPGAESRAILVPAPLELTPAERAASTVGSAPTAARSVSTAISATAAGSVPTVRAKERALQTAAALPPAVAASSAQTPTASRVDPVFGLEVPAQ